MLRMEELVVVQAELWFRKGRCVLRNIHSGRSEIRGRVDLYTAVYVQNSK